MTDNKKKSIFTQDQEQTNDTAKKEKKKENDTDKEEFVVTPVLGPTVCDDRSIFEPDLKSTDKKCLDFEGIMGPSNKV